MENTFQTRYEELLYLTALNNIKTQSLLQALLAELHEDALFGYELDDKGSIINFHMPGTLAAEGSDRYGKYFWTVEFKDMTQAEQLNLIKHIIENKLHEKAI